MSNFEITQLNHHIRRLNQEIDQLKSDLNQYETVTKLNSAALAERDAEVIEQFIKEVSKVYGYNTEGWQIWAVDVEDMEHHANQLRQKAQEQNQ